MVYAFRYIHKDYKHEDFLNNPHVLISSATCNSLLDLINYFKFYYPDYIFLTTIL